MPPWQSTHKQIFVALGAANSLPWIIYYNKCSLSSLSVLRVFELQEKEWLLNRNSMLEMLSWSIAMEKKWNATSCFTWLAKGINGWLVLWTQSATAMRQHGEAVRHLGSGVILSGFTSAPYRFPPFGPVTELSYTSLFSEVKKRPQEKHLSLKAASEG